MKTTIHKADSRGHANHGWLDSYHTFSFAGYMNPERMHFGVLRVLNDDKVAAGMGFGTHPHDNMEIVSIALKGALEHKDSMGNTQVIQEGDVQIMSAGTGVYHSEYNRNKNEEVNFLQIWIFPKKKNINPRYDQRNFPKEQRKNNFLEVVSPEGNGTGIGINQDAWLSIGNLDTGKELSYTIKRKENGLYVFVLEGEVQVAGEILSRRDGIGISDAAEIKFTANTNAELLLLDIPM